jgi:hypothetical protein
MATRRRPIQSPSAICKAQGWADKWVAMNEALTWEEAALRNIAELASALYHLPQFRMEHFDYYEAQGIDRDGSNLFCELGAQYLERGEMPPEPLRKFLVKILRAAIKPRGKLIDRDGLIVSTLLHLEKLGLPLFPNRDAPRENQTYARDIVIKAFKKVGISISESTVEKVWKSWSPYFVRTF